MQAVFDGHNDVLLRLWKSASTGSDPVDQFMKGNGKGHIDLPRARTGGLAGGLCAIYLPSGDLVLREPDANGHYATPLSPSLDRPRIARHRAPDSGHRFEAGSGRRLEAVPDGC